MAGVKGRSGGKRYAKSDEEKKTISKLCKFSSDTIVKMQQIAISRYGTDQYTMMKVIEDAISLLYEKTILARLPPQTRQGTYLEFRADFMNIYRPDINNPALERDYYISGDLMLYLRKSAGDRKHQEIIVHRIVNTFVDDLQNIYEYFMEKNIYYDFSQIAAYALKYFADSMVTT